MAKQIKVEQSEGKSSEASKSWAKRKYQANQVKVKPSKMFEKS